MFNKKAIKELREDVANLKSSVDSLKVDLDFRNTRPKMNSKNLRELESEISKLKDRVMELEKKKEPEKREKQESSDVVFRNPFSSDYEMVISERAIKQMQGSCTTSLPKPKRKVEDLTIDQLREIIDNKIEKKIEEMTHEENMKRLEEKPETYRCSICDKEGVNEDNFQPYKEKGRDGTYKKVYICAECLTK